MFFKRHDNSKLKDMCKKERRIDTDKVIGNNDSKLPNKKREIPMPKCEFENLLIVNVNVHSTPSNAVGYEIDYIINGIDKRILLWLEGYKSKETLEEELIKHERVTKMKADNKSSKDIINKILHENYPELKERLEKEGIIIRDCVTIGDEYLELTYYHAQDIKGIRMEVSADNIPTNEEIIKRIKRNVQKPPLGIVPHFLWIEQRIDEIIKAMDRYREAKKEIPREWYIELAQLENEKHSKNPMYLTINTNQINADDLKKIKSEMNCDITRLYL
jgi:hypothetical protein